jgi:hypothetical protein
VVDRVGIERHQVPRRRTTPLSAALLWPHVDVALEGRPLGYP